MSKNKNKKKNRNYNKDKNNKKILKEKTYNDKKLNKVQNIETIKITAKETIINSKIDDFDIKKINWNLEHNPFDGKQFITFPRYQSNLIFKTQEIKMSEHGIKKLDKKLVTDDSKRCYIRIPEEKESPEDLFKFFEKLDNYMIQNKEKILSDLEINLFIKNDI